MVNTQSTPFALTSWVRESAGRQIPAPVARARVSAAVILLDLLKWACELDLADHLMPDGRFYAFRDESLRRALQAFGWRVGVLKTHEPYVGCIEPALGSLLAALRARDLDLEPVGRRFVLIEEMQRYLLDQARMRFCRRGLRLNVDTSFATSAIIQKLLERASSQGKADAMARHLVGAALKIRFESFEDAADRADNFGSTGLSGDFAVGEAVFQVTWLPKTGHFDRARETLFSGLRPFILVPRDRTPGAKDQAEDTAPGRIIVRSIEDFVGQNLDTYGAFTHSAIKVEIGNLIDAYNQRVMSLDGDRSLMIKMA